MYAPPLTSAPGGTRHRKRSETPKGLAKFAESLSRKHAAESKTNRVYAGLEFLETLNNKKGVGNRSFPVISPSSTSSSSSSSSSSPSSSSKGYGARTSRTRVHSQMSDTEEKKCRERSSSPLLKHTGKRGGRNTPSPSPHSLRPLSAGIHHLASSPHSPTSTLRAGRTFTFSPAYENRPGTAKSSGEKCSHGSQSTEQLYINIPHRLSPPKDCNVPKRCDPWSDTQSVKDASSMTAIRATREMLDDYNLKAIACKRAGVQQGEATAWYSKGVIYDNLREYTKAIKCYEKYLHICSKIDDVGGKAIAYNSLAISYQCLGTDSLPAAIYFHAKHRDIADKPGKFIAHSNLGILYFKLEDFPNSISNHQASLRWAVLNKSQTGQSIAIGNLGLAMAGRSEQHNKNNDENDNVDDKVHATSSIRERGKEDEEQTIPSSDNTIEPQPSASSDLVTAKACMERHLELTDSLGDHRNKIEALMRLSEISHQQEDLEEALGYLREAMEEVKLHGDASTSDKVKVSMGVIQGELRIKQLLAGKANLFF